MSAAGLEDNGSTWRFGQSKGFNQTAGKQESRLIKGFPLL
jgi:hypothetical protein